MRYNYFARKMSVLIWETLLDNFINMELKWIPKLPYLNFDCVKTDLIEGLSMWTTDLIGRT